MSSGLLVFLWASILWISTPLSDLACSYCTVHSLVLGKLATDGKRDASRQASEGKKLARKEKLPRAVLPSV